MEDTTMEICYRSDERLTGKAAADLLCCSQRTAYRRISTLRFLTGKPFPKMLTVGDLARAYGVERRVRWE